MKIEFKLECSTEELQLLLSTNLSKLVKSINIENTSEDNSEPITEVKSEDEPKPTYVKGNGFESLEDI